MGKGQYNKTAAAQLKNVIGSVKTLSKSPNTLSNRVDKIMSVARAPARAGAGARAKAMTSGTQGGNWKAMTSGTQGGTWKSNSRANTQGGHWMAARTNPNTQGGAWLQF